MSKCVAQRVIMTRCGELVPAGVLIGKPHKNHAHIFNRYTTDISKAVWYTDMIYTQCVLV